MEARIALSLCVVLGSTLCGWTMAGTSKRREQLLNQLIQGIKLLRVHMIRMLEPIQEALVHTGNPLFADIGRRMRGGVSAEAAWQDMLADKKASKPIYVLLSEDRAALNELFSHLGQSGREAQEMALAAALETLEELRKIASERARQASLLYTKLGFLIGLMLGLIFL